ncbi:MAG: hypothetical protein ABIM74_00605 [candidate division WOR-3 bacterium]
MKVRVIPMLFLATCAPKTSSQPGQVESDLTLTLGYQGGLVPIQARFGAPYLIILKNGGVFKLTEEGETLRYAGFLPEDRARFIGFARRLWDSGLEGNFSVMEGATDLPSLVIRMKKGEETREISIYGYPMGRLKKPGGQFIDSIMALAGSAKTTAEGWVPWEVELRAMSWAGDTAGLRVYDWEGPDIPLDSLAEGYLAAEIGGDTARELIIYLTGKTAYTRRDMALFRKGGKLYWVAIIPILR